MPDEVAGMKPLVPVRAWHGARIHAARIQISETESVAMCGYFARRAVPGVPISCKKCLRVIRTREAPESEE